MKTDNAYIHVGLDFVSPSTGRITNIQLVDRERGAIAICDFKDGEVSRLAYNADVDREKFVKDAKSLLENSIPVQFHETKLP